MSGISTVKREGMKYNRLSFFSVLVVLGTVPTVSDAGIRVGNLSRTNAQGYQQVNTQRYQQEISDAQQSVQELPIKVANQDLAQQIQNGDMKSSVTIDHLDKCKMIYPNGEFEWAVPTVGLRAGGAPTCTSVVELRVLAPDNGKEYTVLARANLAAGDSVKCNISDFPESSLLPAAGEIIFPTDEQPTVEDVIEVMNEEQKQNAALKIIGGAVMFGLAGNAVGKNEVGNDGIFGGGKDKITSTIVGTVGGAGLMAASTYSGKVAGDMIMSAGVNAAAGAVMGNIITGGDDVMRIERCIIDGNPDYCLWGYIKKKGDHLKHAYVKLNSSAGTFIKCDVADDESDCRYADLEGGRIPGITSSCNSNDAKDSSTSSSLAYILTNCKDEIDHKYKHCYKNGKMEELSDSCEEVYIQISDAYEVTDRIPAMMVGVKEPTFGYKCKDIDAVKKDFPNSQIVGNNGKGGEAPLKELPPGSSASDLFEPACRRAGGGDIIDMSNKARLKGTLTGAGVGGAAGAFTAYQGAQNEIQERWVTAVREYKDSLQKFYCGTGNRYMSFYNDEAVVPALGSVK